MDIIGDLLNLAIEILKIIIIAQVLVSWLIAFDVINARSPQAQNLIRLLHKVTDPIYKPLQKYIPPIGGIDITPMIVIIGLILIQGYVVNPLFY